MKKFAKYLQILIRFVLKTNFMSLNFKFDCILVEKKNLNVKKFKISKKRKDK